jgi:hypothetical protein
MPVLLLLFILSLCLPSAPASGLDLRWKELDPGLSLIEADSQKLFLLKINPKYFFFRLLCASEQKGPALTLRKWSETYHLVSAINAGMFQADGLTNVGFMKNYAHLNNPRLNTTYRTVLAFNPVEVSVPDVQIIDLTCQDFGKLKGKYFTFAQGIRMINCRQENVWEKQDRRWSVAAFGMDKAGDALFIMSEPRYSVHELAQLLLSLPISLHNAMYLEGGPQATLYLSFKGLEMEKVGSYETGMNDDAFPRIPRAAPNVIGIVKKPR